MKTIYGIEGKSLHVPLNKVSISGHLLQGYGLFKMKQNYNNVNSVEIYTRYIFPLPANAVLKGFKMFVNKSKLLSSEIMTHSEAEELFSTSIEKGDLSAAIEMIAPNVYCISIGRMEKASNVEIIVDYYMEIPETSDKMQLVIPLVYSPAKTYPEMPEVYNIWREDTPYSAHIDLEICDYAATEEITSNTHNITIDNNEESFANIYFSDEKVSMDRDFVLNIKYKEKRKNSVIAYKDMDGSGIAYYSLFPKIKNDENIRPENYIFIIDCTSATSIGKYNNIKSALYASLDMLKDSDRFNIITFGGKINRFNKDFVEKNGQNVADARNFVENANLRNGTTLLNALASVEKEIKNENTCAFVFTDENMSNPEALCTYAQKNLTQTKIISFIFDSIVDSELITRFSNIVDGAFEVIYPDDNVVPKVKSAFSKLEKGSVKKVSATPMAMQCSEIFPRYYERVFDGQKLTFLVQFIGLLSNRISLTDISHSWFEEISINVPESFEGFAMLDSLFANLKVKQLYKILKDSPEQAHSNIIEEIVTLSKKYEIVTKYTQSTAILALNRKAVPIVKEVINPLSKRKFFFKINDEMGMFFEKDKKSYSKDYLITLSKKCENLILENFRPDSMIAAPNVFSTDKCLISTALAVIALLSLNSEKYKSHPVIMSFIEKAIIKFEASKNLDPKVAAALFYCIGKDFVYGENYNKSKEILSALNVNKDFVTNLIENLGEINYIIDLMNSEQNIEEALECASILLILISDVLIPKSYI